MKLLITIALLSIGGFLFAQTDTPIKKVPVTVFKDGKAVGVKLVPQNKDSSIVENNPSTLNVKDITVAKDYPIWHNNMSFLEKCKYWILWFKYEHKYIFWTLVVLFGLWILKILFKLFDR